MTITDVISFENRRFLNCFSQLVAATKHWRVVQRKQLSLETAVRELESFEDYQLADIGLTRSDLTVEGLATAGEKRAWLQSRIERMETWEKVSL